MRFRRAGMFGGLSLAVSAMLVGAVCGEASASVRVTEPSNISTNSFNNSFTIMKQFKSLAAAGKGKVAAILPDTVSSTRYVEFDQPDITKALSTAGLSSSQYVVQNALGSDATQLTDAQTDISNGATVLLVDPLDSGRGRADRELRQVARRQGHRLRPPHPRRQPRLLRQLQQRDGRQDHGGGPGELRRRLARQEAAGRRDARRRDRQQRHAVRTGLRLGASTRSSRAASGPRWPTRPGRGTRRRPRPSSRPSTPRTRTSTRR